MAHICVMCEMNIRPTPMLHIILKVECIHLVKKITFCDFLFALLHPKSLLKRVLKNPHIHPLVSRQFP